MNPMRKKEKYQYGFTLLELLAVIVILGIVLTIVVPSISRAILVARIKFYENQENILLATGRYYFTSGGRNVLPKDLGEKKTVTVSTLIQEGYINSIIDDRNRPCNYEQSYVEVTQIGKGDYQYYVRLVCNEYDTALSYTDWSDWQTEYPKGANIEIQEGDFYNYQELITYYGDWSDWVDVVAYRDLIQRLATVIGQERETRTLYRYRDQQWKWYKIDTEISACLTSSPGTEWGLYSTDCTPDIEESSCSASSPGTGWTQGLRCADPPGPTTNPSSCRSSTPSPHPGGTWHWYDECSPSYSCPSGWTRSGSTCSRSYTVTSVVGCDCVCSSSLTWDCWDNGECDGNCNDDCPPPYDYCCARKTGGSCGGSCLYEGATKSGSNSWSATCSATIDADVTYRDRYLWMATPTYVWNKSISRSKYSRNINTYHADFSSTAPTGYPNKDENQTQYTVWSSWDITVPTSYPYRTVEDRMQERVRDILQDWSGNKLPDYISVSELENLLGKNINEIKADPNFKLLGPIKKYRYRERKLIN